MTAAPAHSSPLRAVPRGVAHRLRRRVKNTTPLPKAHTTRGQSGGGVSEEGEIGKKDYRLRSKGIVSFLGLPEHGDKDTHGNTAIPQVKAQTRQPDYIELVKDEVKLTEVIRRCLARYLSVSSHRLVKDLLGSCVQDLVDAFLKYVKPALLLMEKQRLVELVRGDPLVGIMVVNLVRDDDKAEGGER